MSCRSVEKSPGKSQSHKWHAVEQKHVSRLARWDWFSIVFQKSNSQEIARVFFFLLFQFCPENVCHYFVLVWVKLENCWSFMCLCWVLRAFSHWVIWSEPQIVVWQVWNLIHSDWNHTSQLWFAKKMWWCSLQHECRQTLQASTKKN